MGLIATVRTDDYPDDDPDLDPAYDDNVVCEVAFEAAEILPFVKRLLPKLAAVGVSKHFRVLTPDSLLEVFENGGDVEAADVEDLADELAQVEEALDDITFEHPGDSLHREHFLDGLKELIEASLENQASIVIVNDEESVALADDDDDDADALEDDSTAGDAAAGASADEASDDMDDFVVMAEDDDDDDDDEDTDPEFEAAMEAEFAGEFEPPSPRSSPHRKGKGPRS